MKTTKESFDDAEWKQDFERSLRDLDRLCDSLDRIAALLASPLVDGDKGKRKKGGAS